MSSHSKKNLIWEKYEHSKFWDNKSPNFGTPTWEFWGKVTFGCNPMERHKIYYREGIGASSQRLWAVWSLCLRLSLLSSLHHIHSTCTNRPLFLLVQVHIILNFHLWICPSPIPKLQHTFLFLKCCKLGSMPQFYFFLLFHSEAHLWVPWRVWGRINVVWKTLA